VREHRRRLPRQPTDWSGRYTVEGADDRRWGSCFILDISVLGAGLELFGSPLDDSVIGHDLLVEVQTPAGASITVQIMGTIRYLAEGNRGGVRIGIEFQGLSKTESEILDVLENMRAVW
jgi:PilZ domain-containing protein